MSRFADEVDLRVPGMARVNVEHVASAFLDQFAPEHLARPGPLDLHRMVDGALEPHGVSFYPVARAELPDAKAVTVPLEEGTQVLVQVDHYERLFDRSAQSRQPMATIAHEIGHAVLHAAFVRRLRRLPPAQQELRRTTRGKVPPYESAEWQAWIFGGCILMPPSLVAQLVGLPMDEVAHTFGVSEVMLRSHLRGVLQHHRLAEIRGRLAHASAPQKNSGRLGGRPE